ncbi:MAG: hypothetical protein ACF8GE_04515 [Phycisphaerales bacterium JB043]
MSRTRTIMITGLSVTTALLSACGGSDSAPKAGAEHETPSWMLASSPPDAQNVNDAKASAQEGDIIVLRGRIGGRTEPITPESPVFTIVDLSLPHCGEMEADSCSTPWDYCCELPETIAANAATVQVVDEHNRPVASNLLSYGFSPLDEVIIIGRAGSRPNRTVLTIQATGVFSVPE